MSTMGIDPFELKQWELDTEIENYHSRNGPRRGYDSSSRAVRSTAFDQVESYEGGSPRRLEFAELLQWQRDHGSMSYDDCARLRHRCATRSTGFDQVESYEGEPPPRLAQLRELLGYSRHRCATRSTSFDMQDSYNSHWHRGQEGEVKHRSRR